MVNFKVRDLPPLSYFYRLRGVKMACAVVAVPVFLMAGCSDNNDSNDSNDSNGSNTVTAQRLSCDESLMALDLGELTEITAVQAVAEGEELADGLSWPLGTPFIAPADFCLVHLNVGPGNPGPEDATSTSKGIGIEVWLPAHEDWNKRYVSNGGGGWAGTEAVSDPDAVASVVGARTIQITRGFVTSVTDTGHIGTSNLDGSFGMNPDGTLNWTLLEDFAERALYEQTVKSQALAEAFYAEDISYS